MILLDTHVAAWLVLRPERLSREATLAIRRGAKDGLGVASVTLIELSQMLARGDIRPRTTPQSWLRDFVSRTGVAVRDISVEIAAVAGHLPPTFPADPFDRVIAATAIVERSTLVTADTRIHDSGVVKAVW